MSGIFDFTYWMSDDPEVLGALRVCDAMFAAWNEKLKAFHDRYGVWPYFADDGRCVASTPSDLLPGRWTKESPHAASRPLKGNVEGRALLASMDRPTPAIPGLPHSPTRLYLYEGAVHTFSMGREFEPAAPWKRTTRFRCELAEAKGEAVLRWSW